MLDSDTHDDPDGKFEMSITIRARDFPFLCAMTSRRLSRTDKV